MATTNKLTAFNGYYGYSSFSNSAATHLYVGANSSTTKYDYRSRLTFNPISSIEAVGNSRIKITNAILYLRRNNEGPTTITIGCSSSSAWDAPLTASTEATIDDVTEWYALDITSLGSAISKYESNWYIHLRNGIPRIRLSGTGSDYKPYLKITWEYVAATISGDKDEAELGSQINYTVVPEIEGETHTLTYEIGDQSGIIAENAGNVISWTPSLELATEFTNDDVGVAAIHMTAYDPSGNVVRTELYYQTLSAPENMKPSIYESGLIIDSGISGYALAGRSVFTLSPSVDVNACYGALPSNIVATITNNNVIQEFTWSNFYEDAPGIYVGESLTSAVITTAGETILRLVATDTRGRTDEFIQTITTLSYSLPQIIEFSVERYEAVYDENEEITNYAPSDLGGYVWVNIDASVCEIAPTGTQLNSLAWRIDGVSSNEESISVEGYSDRSIKVVSDRTLLSEPIGEGGSWQYVLTVTDTVGSVAVQYSTVLPAHAAMSVSPDKYGLAIGMIASGTQTNPRFEVDDGYQSHFYGDVYGYGEIYVAGGVHGNGGLYGANGKRIDVGSQATINAFSNTFTFYENESNSPVVRRVGAMVQIDGICTTTENISGSATELEMFTIPVDFCPATDVYQLCQGGTQRFWLLHVAPTGQITFSRYRNGGSYDSLSKGSTLFIHATWIAKDAFA